MPTDTELLDGLHIINAKHTSEPDVEQPYGKTTLHPPYQRGTHFATLYQRDTGSEFFLHPAPISCKTASPDKLVCKSISKLDFPGEWVLIEQALDIKNKRIYALFSLPSDNYLRVFIVLDWRTCQSVSFDTGLAYHPETTASSFRLSYRGESFDVFTDRSGDWCLKSYSLSQVMQRAGTFCEVIESSHDCVPPTREIALDFDPWPNPPLTNLLSIRMLFRHWTIPQPSQFPHSTPSYFSHIHLYSLNSLHCDWRLSQYYSDASGTPCSRRSFWDLDHSDRPEVFGYDEPPHYALLMSVAFTHIAWVASNAVMWQGWMRWKRALKLIAFPECKSSSEIGESRHDSDMQRLTSKTLDVPSRTLERACDIYLEPALASIFIATEGNELHKYQYA